MMQVLLGIWFLMVIGLVVWKAMRPEMQAKNDVSHDDLIRYKALDEVRRKCREVTESGEVSYFTLDDIDRIIDELKR